MLLGHLIYTTLTLRVHGTTEHMFRGSGSVVPWTRKVKVVYIG